MFHPPVTRMPSTALNDMDNIGSLMLWACMICVHEWLWKRYILPSAQPTTASCPPSPPYVNVY